MRRRLWRLALLAPHTALQLRDEVEIQELPKADATARLRHVLGAGCVLSRRERANKTLLNHSYYKERCLIKYDIKIHVTLYI